MARPLRIVYPGAFYHVTSRGNGQKDVFKNQKDQEKFLSYGESAGVRYGAVVHIWCLSVFHSKKVGHCVWPYCRARVAWTMMAFNLLSLWGLEMALPGAITRKSSAYSVVPSENRVRVAIGDRTVCRPMPR